MWNLLKRRTDECNHLRDALENSGAARPRAIDVEDLLNTLPPALRAHAASCQSCREAAEDLLATRSIFEGVASYGEEVGPWFATRVMTAIAARERELSEVASTWLAVPKFAARLALALGAVLLVASTWLYQRPSKAPPKQPSAAATQEYLFEAPQPAMNQDDVLISMAEKNQ